MAKVKKRSLRGPRPAGQSPAPVPVDLTAYEATLADLAEQLLKTEPPTSETVAAALAQIRELGQAVAPAALSWLAQKGGIQALPVLEAALMDETLAWAAVQALARVKEPAAAQLLDSVARTHANRAVVKAARKALYELRRAGVMWETPVEEAPREERPLYKVLASQIDSEGTRSIWIARRGAFGGLRVANFILNEVVGIKDCYGAERIGKVDFDRLIEDAAQDSPPFIYAEIGLPHARRLIEEARAQNKETGSQLPLDFYTWKDILGEPSPDEVEPQPVVELSPEVVSGHPEWLDQAPGLLDLPACRFWLLERELVEPYVDYYTRNVVRGLESQAEGITDLGVVQNEGIIVRRVVREVFDEKRAARMQRRLEETALLLWLTGQPEAARWAAATALALAAGTPPEEVPFLYELARRSLDLRIAEILAELKESGALDEGEEEEEKPPLILLPGEGRHPQPGPVDGQRKSAGGVYLPK